MSPGRQLSVLAGLVLLLTVSSFADASTVEIRGHVLLAENPVENAVVRAIGTRGPDEAALELASDRSDSSGRFALEIPWNEAENEPVARLLEVTARGMTPRVVEIDGRLPGPGAADHVGAIRLDRDYAVEGSVEAPPDGIAGDSALVLWRDGLDRPTARFRLTWGQGADEVRFRFPPVGPGPYTLGLVRGDGVVERLGPMVATATGRPRRLRPSPISFTTGHVVDEQGDPVVGAAVRALAPAPAGAPPRWLDPRPVRTDQAGGFRVAHPTAHSWILEVERAGFQTIRRTFDAVPALPGRDSEIAVILRSSARLAGEIVATDELELEFEVEGAAVTVTPLTAAPVTRFVCVSTDRYGAFVTPPLSRGDHRVTVTATGYRPVERIVSVTTDSLEMPHLRFQLDPLGTATLRLEIIQRGEVPIGNAEVWVQDKDSDLHRRVHLAADGTAALAAVPEDLELSVTVLHSWHEPFYLGRTHRIDRDGPIVTIDLRAPPWRLAAADGLVVDDLGRPIADARIEAFLLNQHSGLSYYAVSDPDGRFTVGPMPEGAYWLRTVAEGFADSITGLKVAPGEPGHHIVLVEGTTLTGEFPSSTTAGSWRVFAARLGEGEGLESYEATFSFRGYPSEITYGSVRGDGYRIERLPPGRWVIVAERGEGVDRVEHRGVIEVAPGDRAVRLELEPFDLGRERLELPVVGRVIDVATGAGLAGVEIRAGRLLYRSPGQLATPASLSEDDGNFRLDPGLTLPLRLFFHRNGYTRGQALITSETADHELQVALTPTPGLHYRVEWFDGAEVLLQDVTLQGESGEVFRHDELDYRVARGHWRSAPRGRHTLELDYQWGVIRLPVEVPGPEVHVVLPPTGMAGLRIPDLELEMDDGWLDDVVITATPVGEPRGRSPITEQGVYSLGLLPGWWRLDVTASERRFWTTEIEIRNRAWTTALFN